MKHKISQFIIAATVLLLMLVVLGNMLESSKSNEVRGHIMMSLAKEGQSVGLYHIDLSSEDLSEATISEFFSVENAAVMQVETAQIGEGNLDSFYVLAALDDDGQTKSNIVYVNSVGETGVLMPAQNNLVKERDLDYSVSKRLLAFSAQEISAAEVLDQSVDDVSSVSAWGVYYLDVITKKITYVAPGRDPQWSPDGESLMFLGSDGVYHYSLESKKLSLIPAPLGFSFEVGENMNLDIAKESNIIAISSPNDFVLYLGEISDWENPRITTLEGFGTPFDAGAPWAFYWPTLSPDGAFVAVQFAETATDSGVSQNPRIGIIDVKEMEMIHSWSIAEYDFRRAFIDEWYY